MDRPETIELVGQTLWWRRERAVWETAEPGARPRLVAYYSGDDDLADSARARVDDILARLDVTGPVVRCAACPIRARAGEPCGHDVEDCVAYGGPTVTEPVAQPGEADEESAAREAVARVEREALDALMRWGICGPPDGTTAGERAERLMDARDRLIAIRAKKGAGS